MSEYLSEHPNPQLERQKWQSLDGSWQFSFDEGELPEKVDWTHEITVPFPPESKASGVHDEEFHPCVWYRRTFALPSDWQGQRVRLHFGAVDYRAQVWVNAQHVVTHEGGHTPFWADVTHALTGGDEEVGGEIVVRAEDDPHDLAKPRGKQDWLREPHGIWYPRTTGIWQSVWLEPVPEVHLSELRLTPDAAAFGIVLEAQAVGAQAAGLSLEVTLRLGDEVLVQDSFGLTDGRVKRTLHLPDPGIDDARARFVWSPEKPTLLDLELKLKRQDEVVDAVTSYTALRSVGTRGGSFFLNERPYFLRLALDQGYWDDTLLAASDDALRKDVELAKAMGFNGVRKHQKLENPRYLYWADRLGLLVWTELPSAYAFTPGAAERLTREWSDALKRDYNHPCVVTWVAFNESWGVPDLPLSAPQQNLVAALYHLAKAFDDTRPVVGNDGWEHVVSDLFTVHDYSSDPEALRARYGTPDETDLSVRPAGRDLVLSGIDLGDIPVILSEFGGVRYARDGEGWGYDQVESSEALLEKYRALIAAASSPGLAGFCYTQFADTFQEQNGLLFSNRTPKIALEELFEATAQRKRG